jgi:hypothetical protein
MLPFFTRSSEGPGLTLVGLATLLRHEQGAVFSILRALSLDPPWKVLALAGRDARMPF